MSVPRGLRNNNPGNINYIGQPNSHCEIGGRFAVFDNMEQGITALKDQLVRYFNEGINTPKSIISKWAPPAENNTKAYISFVSSKLGTTPENRLSCNPETLEILMNSIIQYENGQNPVENLVKKCVLEGVN